MGQLFNGYNAKVQLNALLTIMGEMGASEHPIMIILPFFHYIHLFKCDFSKSLSIRLSVHHNLLADLKKILIWPTERYRDIDDLCQSLGAAL